MQKVRNISFLIILSAVSLSAVGAQTPPRRVSTMSPSDLNTFFEGDDDGAVVEFRAGDTLAVRLTFTGDLLESTAHDPTPVRIKKGFFVKRDGDDLLLSWDGQTFKSYREMITGEISARAGGEQGATTLDVAIGAYVRD